MTIISSNLEHRISEEEILSVKVSTTSMTTIAMEIAVEVEGIEEEGEVVEEEEDNSLEMSLIILEGTIILEEEGWGWHRGRDKEGSTREELIREDLDLTRVGWVRED